jgi:hypothetical protein
MVATRAWGDAAEFHASPTPRWPVSVSRKTRTMTFSCHRIRGFQSRPPMSRRTTRGMIRVTFTTGRVDHDRGRRQPVAAAAGPPASTRCAGTATSFDGSGPAVLAAGRAARPSTRRPRVDFRLAAQ